MKWWQIKTSGSWKDDFWRICIVFRWRPSYIGVKLHFGHHWQSGSFVEQLWIFYNIRTTIWTSGGHFGRQNNSILTKITPGRSPYRYPQFYINITIFGKKWTHIWPMDITHFWLRVRYLNISEIALYINHSYQVSAKSAWRFMRIRILEECVLN